MQSIYYTLCDGPESVRVKTLITLLSDTLSVQCFNMISAYKSVAIRVIGLGDMGSMFSYQFMSIYG